MKKSRTKFLSVFAILFVAIFAVSCCFFAACGNKDEEDNSGDTGTQQGDGEGSGNVDATVTGVSVAPTTLPIEEGKTGSVTATVTMSDTSASYSGTYAWESDKESVATVSGTGATATVTAVAEGTANITVTVEDQSATCAVTVTAAEIVPEVKDVITVATPEEKSYTTAESAVFENRADLSISRNGTSYSVSGTASVMGEAEAEWYATEDVEKGTPYVVLKMSVATGESVYFVNSEKTYENKEGGANYSAFDEEYLYVVVALSEGDDGLYGTNEYTFTFSDETSETYSVSFAGVEYPKEDEPLYDPEKNVYSFSIDFSDGTTYSWIKTTSEETEKNEATVMKTSIVEETQTNGIISLYGKGMTIGFESENSMNFGGYTSKSNGRYYAINVGDYVGDYIEIAATFTTNSEGKERALLVDTFYEYTSEGAASTSSTALARAASSTKEYTTPLAYGQTITSTDSVLYVICDASVNLYTLEINIYGDVKPKDIEIPQEDQSVSLTFSFGESGVVYSYSSDDVYTANKTTLSYSGSTQSGKKPTYNSMEYTLYAVQMKNSNARQLTIAIPEGATNVSITCLISSDATSPVCYLSTASLSSAEGALVASIGTDENCGTNTYIVTASNLTGGTYYMFGDSTGVYLCGGVITYDMIVSE